MQTQHCRVESLIVHRVGNKARDEGLMLSDSPATVDEPVAGLILDGYLKGVASDKKRFQFFHESELRLNEIYHYTRQFFAGELDFLEVSRRIARHLYARSQHPNISAGDLFVILFSGMDDDNQPERALGIFKSEIRDDFLTLTEAGSRIDLSHAQGINPNLIDKGALVMEHSPTVYAVDRFGQKTKYWLEDFLKARRIPDLRSSTQMMTRVLEQLSEGIDDPVEQVRFKDEVLTLCGSEETLPARDVTAMAERFVPKDHIDSAMKDATERWGFELEDSARLTGQGMAKRLERTLSKASLGHGISLLLPSGFRLENLRSVNEGEDGLTLTLKLSRRD